MSRKEEAHFASSFAMYAWSSGIRPSTFDSEVHNSVAAVAPSCSWFIVGFREVVDEMGLEPGTQYSWIQKLRARLLQILKAVPGVDTTDFRQTEHPE
jgi:hypothetical protein